MIVGYGRAYRYQAHIAQYLIYGQALDIYKTVLSGVNKVVIAENFSSSVFNKLQADMPLARIPSTSAFSRLNS